MFLGFTIQTFPLDGSTGHSPLTYRAGALRRWMPWLLVGMCISGKNTIRYSLIRIRILFENRSIKKRTRARMHEHRRHAHTMTQEEVFYDLYEINWFNSTTAPSSAINIKLFQRRLTKCAENSCQLSRFHTLLPVYTRTHATHPISHGKK